MAYLWKKSPKKGWLRQLEARLSGRALGEKPKDEEKNLALKLYLSLQSCTGAADAIACAWGVTRVTVYNWKANAD
jgi:DNA invertase Pin-like site-specific DNA recombinase